MKQQSHQAAWNKKNIARRRVWNATWIKNNRDRYNASKARYRFKLKIEGLKLYADPAVCARCGCSKLDCLVLDHVNDDGAAHRRLEKLSCRGSGSGSNIYELLRRKGRIDGLQVLCANCNMAKSLRKNRRDSIRDPQLLREIESVYGYQDS